MDAGISEAMLEQMIECGRAFERTPRGRALSVRQHGDRAARDPRGTHRPYPCGAGAGYLGVSADGGISPAIASSRTMRARSATSARASIDRAQRRWLADRHVHRQEPCTRVLGALPVRRRLPPRGHPPRPTGVRLYPRLAALLPRRLRSPAGGCDPISSVSSRTDVRAARRALIRHQVMVPDR